MWLHHTVLSNTNRSSLVCPNNFAGDRFFASGNERTPIDICVGGYVFPFPLNKPMASTPLHPNPTPKVPFLTNPETP